jgi:glyoxylase-like metal-dependent hydrolase (beta-lactamase superfamily II)
MERITDSVYLIKTPMGVHYVNSYLVVGNKQIVIVDTGLPETFDSILAAVKEIGRDNRPVGGILITHGHPDHIGSNYRLRERFTVPIIAPAGAVSWIEDHDRQFSEFPGAFPEAFLPDDEFKSFWMSLMDGETIVDIAFQGSITFKLGSQVSLISMAFPGHSTHETGYYEPGSKCLVLGDAISLDHPDGFPAYEDPDIYRDTLKKILEMVNGGEAAHVVVGHYRPLDPPAAKEVLQHSLDQIEEIDKAVSQIIESAERKLTLKEIGERAAEKIQRTYNFQTPWTIYGHLKHMEKRGLVRTLDGYWMEKY